MKWFKKNKKIDDNEDITSLNKKVNKAEYKVVIKQKVGGAARTIKTITASRWKDEEDEIVYLKNDTEKFIEIMPESVNDLKNYTEKEVDDLITKYEKILREERKTDTEDINEKNIEFELLKLKAKKRGFKYDSNASYEDLDENNKPTYTFLRVGSNFLPFKWDLNTQTQFIPSDNRKKNANLVLRNKRSKYDTNKLITGSTILMIVIGFIMMAVGGYLIKTGVDKNNQAFLAYDESNIAAAQRNQLENINQMSDNIAKQSDSINNIVDKLENQVNRPQTIIQGVTPE